MFTRKNKELREQNKSLLEEQELLKAELFSSKQQQTALEETFTVLREKEKVTRETLRPLEEHYEKRGAFYADESYSLEKSYWNLREASIDIKDYGEMVNKACKYEDAIKRGFRYV
jgi:hypothetical protein